MKERLFKFKEFSVKHARSAMKVGVDGVLIGAWATSNGEHILDVGTGCGLIALMLAQRNSQALIDGIDIDPNSVEEAKENVEMSPWNDRIRIDRISFDEVCRSKMICRNKNEEGDVNNENLYDLIVSNPPFYDSGVKDPSTPRERSRHQGDLSPESLIVNSCRLLRPKGRLALIAPAEKGEALFQCARSANMIPHRVCYVRDHSTSPEKRIMIEMVYCQDMEAPITFQEEHLVMYELTGEPTLRYRTLCKPFYLRF
ncbi:MAG: methyltransferase [Muribaculaceae bacterium]|nr:methyltransferase [Muribaculaceae bacterium]MDE6770200.1 methyltransferase [Muribaculaceae bacterium]